MKAVKLTDIRRPLSRTRTNGNLFPSSSSFKHSMPRASHLSRPIVRCRPKQGESIGGVHRRNRPSRTSKPVHKLQCNLSAILMLVRQDAGPVMDKRIET